MFFRELEIPLMDIKKIMDNPNYDKEQALLSQKSLLEQKRNRQCNSALLWDITRRNDTMGGFLWIAQKHIRNTLYIGKTQMGECISGKPGAIIIACKISEKGLPQNEIFIQDIIAVMISGWHILLK